MRLFKIYPALVDIALVVEEFKVVKSFEIALP